MANEKADKKQETKEIIEKLSEELQVEKKSEEAGAEKAEEAKPAEAPKVTELARGVFSYGNITVGENGQILLPKEVLEHFDIKTGDKLIIVGDVKKGIGLAKGDAMKDLFMKIMGVIREVEKKVDEAK